MSFYHDNKVKQLAHLVKLLERPLPRGNAAEGPATYERLAGRTAWNGVTRGMLDWNDCPAVERVPGRVSGAWVFKGTRVPVRALFENLEEGASVTDFLDWFPGVTEEQARAVLEHADRSLTIA